MHTDTGSTMLVFIAGILSSEFIQSWFGVALTVMSFIYVTIKVIKEIRDWKQKK